MKDYSFALGANERQAIHAAPRFLRVKSATGAIKIEARGGIELTLSEGDSFTVPVPLADLSVTDASGASNSVTLTLGDGRAESNAVSGSVTVTSGSIAINNTPTIQGVTDPVTISPTAVPSSASAYYRRGASSALQVVVTPAANVNGIVIYALGASTYGFNRWMAKASAPTSIDDAAAWTLLRAGIGANTAYWPVSEVPLPLQLPAGLGLYAQDDQPSWQSQNHAIYEVL